MFRMHNWALLEHLPRTEATTSVCQQSIGSTAETASYGTQSTLLFVYLY